MTDLKILRVAKFVFKQMLGGAGKGLVRCKRCELSVPAPLNPLHNLHFRVPRINSEKENIRSEYNSHLLQKFVTLPEKKIN